MATAQCSYGPSLIFTQSEATAAQRTWAFHLVKAADSTDATGLVPVMTISKAGGAFGAVDAATAITELSNGWYKVVQAAVDFDTIGCLGYRIAVATADTINASHQITALDLNVATVPLATGGIVAGTFAAGAIDAAAVADGALDAATFSASAQLALSQPLLSVVKTFALVADGDAPISMLNAVDTTVEVTGTFGSGSAQVQTTEDPTVTVPVWTNRGSAITSSNAVTPLVVTGPHNAIRVHFTGSTAPALAVKFTIRKPAGA